MKARITGNIGTYYYGEVYQNKKWKRVTKPCLTKTGAKIELKRYKESNIGFEI